MFDIPAQQVWLAPGATDMRKSIDGLSAMAQYALGQNPLQPPLFVFCSKDRSKIKLLYWDQNGFWLFYKRLEKGTFRWPADAQAIVMAAGRTRHRTSQRASPDPGDAGGIAIGDKTILQNERNEQGRSQNSRVISRHFH